MSRYISAGRIRRACKRIEAGSTITEAMLDSGFNTKFDFDREFSRITGNALSQWNLGFEGVSPGAKRSEVKEPEYLD